MTEVVGGECLIETVLGKNLAPEILEASSEDQECDGRNFPRSDTLVDCRGNTTNAGEIGQCNALVALLGAGKVFLPGSDGYSSSVASYFCPLQPACFVALQTAQDVAAAVKSLTLGGVTIDLRGLNTTEVSPDEASVSAGAGATWDLVYDKLDTIGRSVAGGRVAGVGVSGLTLGGGISYFGPREGWTCNQAIEFEVLLADGSIITASETERPDLWAALRGTSNNFGIVTKINYRTFEQGPLWYTMTFNHFSVVDQQIAIYADLMSPQKYDVNASANATNANEISPYYKAVVNLPSIPVAGLDGVVASQYTTSPVTFEPTEAMIKEAFAAFNKSLAQVQNITQISWILNLEPLPPQIYKVQGGSGANTLSITGQGGRSPVVCLISVGWPDAAQNQQGVISSYGAESAAKLRRVRDMYDPKHTFTKQVAGKAK
ncbi:putative oxidoreductase [Nemania serpens]|nr:putative oxidoreductase [Nemania serpens]